MGPGRKRKRLAMVRTYGCQQNVSDGEKLKGMFQEMGFGLYRGPGGSGFYFVQYLRDSEHAEDRIFGNVGR